MDSRWPVVLRCTLLLLLLLVAPGPMSALVQVLNRHTVASIPGDLVLGVLVPVHERPSPKQAQTRTCGTVREQYGIQRVEAAMRIIDLINADPNILPNITLGLEVRDSCWFSPIALEQSIEFIRDAMAASEQSQHPSLPSASTTTNALQLQAPFGDTNSTIQATCAPLLAQQRSLMPIKKVKNIVGVVGPASSTDTVQVQNLLQLFNMPQVGYSATSRDLSNKNFFKYFLRVVPADKLQAQVMIDLMLAHNWTYITVTYTEGSYGSSLMNAFRERAQEVGICFATVESTPPNADDAKFDELIEAIQKHPNARVVVCMCEGRTVAKLFSGFKRRNTTNEFLVVGSDGWADRFDVVEKQEEVAVGGLSIRIHSAYVYDFDDYYFALNPFTNHRNPWFAEFWETRFQCNLELGGNARQPANQQRPAGFIRPAGGRLYNRTCTGKESLRSNHKQDAKMAFVQKSIITMALGLDSMQRAICSPNRPGLCPEMLPVNGSILLQHLMNVSFSFLNEEVYFDEQGDSPGKYEILNFQRRVTSTDESDGTDDPLTGNQLPYTSMSAEEKSKLNTLYDSYSTLKVYRHSRRSARSLPARQVDAARSTTQRLQQQGPSSLPASGYSASNGYEYVHVGSWKSSDGLSLFERIRWYSRQEDSATDLAEQAHQQDRNSESPTNVPPKSVCSLPCSKGHAKKIQSDSVKCCWVCVACRPNEYLHDEFKCKACEKGWWPNAEQTGCHQIPIQYFDWRSMEALTAVSIAVFGFTLTIATAFVFIRHNDTPVVKSSTRELSYMILFSMLLSYLNTFFLVAKPSKSACFITRILPGFAFAMMYGALVTKTNRIARILAGSKKKIITRRPRFMSATSQVIITWIIVLMECFIIVFMLVREPADKMLDYPSDEKVVLVCNTTTMGIIAPLGFDFFLIAMCTLYAFKTRNVPENFNEAKFIGFTMYTTLVIWIAFVVIYLSSEHKVTTLCLCISFSALFALFLLFFPRCYIIIFKPEKNNRSYFTTTKNVRCHIGYQQSSSQSHQTATSGNNICYLSAGAVALGAQGTASNSLAEQEPASQDLPSQPAAWSLGQLPFWPMNQYQSHEQQQQQQVSGHTFSKCSRNASFWATRDRVADLAHQRSVRSDSFAADWARLAQSPAADGSANERGATLGQPVALVPGALLNRLRAFVLDRSKRRETDKACSIQRHLRAIRQAEDLDRQTHFRRSQVQRLVQRFDQSSHNLAAHGMGAEGSSDRLLVACADGSGPSRSVGHKEDASASRQQYILLEILSQLIGSGNVRKLAIALGRCARTQCKSPGLSGKTGVCLAGNLDLRVASDRELAIALLNCLGRMVQRSIECLETAGQLASDSSDSIELLLRSSGSQKSYSKARRDSNKVVQSMVQSRSCSKGDNQDDRVRDMSEMNASYHKSSLSQDESVSQEESKEQTRRLVQTDTPDLELACDKSRKCDTVEVVALTPSVPPALHGNPLPPPPAMLALSMQPKLPQASEDPIRRALETIMGASRVRPDSHQPEVERARKCGRSEGRGQHAHRSRSRRPAAEQAPHQHQQHQRRPRSTLRPPQPEMHPALNKHSPSCLRQEDKTGFSSSCSCLSSCCYCCCYCFDQQSPGQDGLTCVSVLTNGQADNNTERACHPRHPAHHSTYRPRSKSPRAQRQANKTSAPETHLVRSTQEPTPAQTLDSSLERYKLTSSDDL